jgi:hypothetical protein
MSRANKTDTHSERKMLKVGVAEEALAGSRRMSRD